MGFSQKETADALGIAQGTVSATQAQATKKLRERLGDSYER
jgi:DNA-directed RNA polymerase specialized sigma24 family protein